DTQLNAACYRELPKIQGLSGPIQPPGAIFLSDFSAAWARLLCSPHCPAAVIPPGRSPSGSRLYTIRGQGCLRRVAHFRRSAPSSPPPPPKRRRGGERRSAHQSQV